MPQHPRHAAPGDLRRVRRSRSHVTHHPRVGADARVGRMVRECPGTQHEARGFEAARRARTAGGRPALPAGRRNSLGDQLRGAVHIQRCGVDHQRLGRDRIEPHGLHGFPRWQHMARDVAGAGGEPAPVLGGVRADQMNQEATLAGAAGDIGPALAARRAGIAAVGAHGPPAAQVVGGHFVGHQVPRRTDVGDVAAGRQRLLDGVDAQVHRAQALCQHSGDGRLAGARQAGECDEHAPLCGVPAARVRRGALRRSNPTARVCVRLSGFGLAMARIAGVPGSAPAGEPGTAAGWLAAAPAAGH